MHMKRFASYSENAFCLFCCPPRNQWQREDESPPALSLNHKGISKWFKALLATSVWSFLTKNRPPLFSRSGQGGIELLPPGSGTGAAALPLLPVLPLLRGWGVLLMLFFFFPPTSSFFFFFSLPPFFSFSPPFFFLFFFFSFWSFFFFFPFLFLSLHGKRNEGLTKQPRCMYPSQHATHGDPSPSTHWFRGTPRCCPRSSPQPPALPPHRYRSYTPQPILRVPD